MCECDSRYDVVAELRLWIEVGCDSSNGRGFHINQFDYNGCSANIDSDAEDGKIFTRGQILFIDIGRNGIGPADALRENLMFKEPRFGRNKNSQIALNVVLTGQDGLPLRQEFDGAFGAGAFLTADGVENNTTQSRGLHKGCTFVDGYFLAVGLKGYLEMSHFVGRRVQAGDPGRQ